MILASVLCLSTCSFGAFAASLRNHVLGSSFGLPGTDASFDYVIVGGGTAGLTIASRLAENASLSVAVIEAGGFYEVDNGEISVIPAFGTFYSGSDPNNTQPLVDWSFVTEPQAGASDRIMHYARGKTLGGSSARNYMLYHRPTVDSLQEWATQVGDPSYTFDQLLPYYKKSVDYTPPDLSLYTNSTNTQTSTAFSSTGGPLQLTFGKIIDSFGTWAEVALTAVGQKTINGFNSGQLIGSAYATFTIDPMARRSSSESSFLQQALNRTTLMVYKQTLAQKILFDSNNVAKGVRVSTQGSYGGSELTYTLSANKEVIVSAGAFQSPQLLMVSGIGPENTLQSLGIPVLKNLPGVGQNLWDQAYFGSAFRVNVPTGSALLNNPSLFAEALESYMANATGPLSIATGGYIGFEKLPQPYRSNLTASTLKALATFPTDWPELEWLPVSGYSGLNRDYQTADPMDGFNYATLATSLVAPLSRGNISINSTSMTDAPLINPNWFTHPADIELAIAGFKRQRQIWGVLTAYNLTIGEEYLPGPAVQTDTQILQFIRESLIEIFHASATCKMGMANDTMAVIDSSTRVYGTKGLRVIDASSFPFLPPGHPQATIYALAEKIADEILQGK